MSDRLKKQNIGPFIYPILAALKDCDEEVSFEEFLPRNFAQKIPFTFEQILSDTTEARNFMKAFEIDTFNGSFAPSPVVFAIDHDRLNDEINPVTKLRYVLESLGISLRSLVMGRGVNSYFMSIPSHFESNFLTALTQDFKAQLQAAGARFPYNSDDYNSFSRPELSCEGIKRASQIAFRRTQNTEDYLNPKRIHYKSAGRDLPVIGRCIKCHAPQANTRAPKIPFHHSNQFAELVRSSNLKQKILRRIQLPHGTRGAMPPRKPLSASEIESMKAFLNQF